MRIIEAKNWTPNDAAYLWVETGIGSLQKVCYIDQSWWIHTGSGTFTQSWCCGPDTRLRINETFRRLRNRTLSEVQLLGCCGPDTRLRIFESGKELEVIENQLQDDLRARRWRWEQRERGVTN